MSDFQSKDDARGLTPSGRAPGSPLRRRSHERCAQELAAGATVYQAVETARALKTDGSSWRANARRLCSRQDIKERVAEILAADATLASIHGAWVANDLKLFARGTLAKFFKYDDGKLVVDERGLPVLDFSSATPDDLRTLSEMKVDKEGRVFIKLQDRQRPLERLGEACGLLRSDREPGDDDAKFIFEIRGGLPDPPIVDVTPAPAKPAPAANGQPTTPPTSPPTAPIDEASADAAYLQTLLAERARRQQQKDQ
jgi:hypothetical protein